MKIFPLSKTNNKKVVEKSFVTENETAKFKYWLLPFFPSTETF
jgi:hypothetical protein